MAFASTIVTFAAPPSSFFRSYLRSCLPPPPSSPSSLASLLASPLTPISATIANPYPLFYVSLLSLLPSNTRNPSTFPVLAHHCSHRRHPPSSPTKSAISISFTDAIALLSDDFHHGLPCFSLFIFSFVSACPFALVTKIERHHRPLLLHLAVVTFLPPFSLLSLAHRPLPSRLHRRKVPLPALPLPIAVPSGHHRHA